MSRQAYTRQDDRDADGQPADRLTEDDILLGGDSVKPRRPAELRGGIGYAIQQIGLFPTTRSPPTSRPCRCC